MEKKRFEKEKQYGAAVAIAGRLLRKGLITEEEHQKLMTVLIQKYQPAISTLLHSSDRPVPKDGQKYVC